MLRTIDTIITARRQLEGGGFQVRRPLPSAGVCRVDPILLIDEAIRDYQLGRMGKIS